MISIRNEDGGSSSQAQRAAYTKLVKQFPNWHEHIIRRKSNIIAPVNMGNDKWKGFIYVNIAGGQQDVIKSHKTDQLLFNPATEYANEQTCLDIDLVMLYFAFFSVDRKKLSKNDINTFTFLLSNIEKYLLHSEYTAGNLLTYCKKHPCLVLENGNLVDPIQV
jgi:hypothetical protein